MKTYRNHLLIALFATITAAAAKDPKPPGDHRPPPLPLLPVLDTDKDGALSAEEIAASSDSLAVLDKNGDGTISRKELLPPPPKKHGADDEDSQAADGAVAPPPPHRKGPPVILRALDTDKDGGLSPEEIDNAPTSLLILDRNNDGTITRVELQPPPPKKD